MKNIGALFDFDETLLEVESARIGIEYLYKEKHVGLPFVLKILFYNFFYKRNLISDEKMAMIMIRFYRNKPLEIFEKGAESFYRDYLKPRLAPNIVQKVREHHAAGHLLVLISASVRYLLEPVARDLKFGHLLCTDLEKGSDGLLTGKPDGPVCIDGHKKVSAEKIARDSGIDLARSYAYGNHHSDIPLLETVGNPFAVEPTPQLADVAVKRQWTVLRYR